MDQLRKKTGAAAVNGARIDRSKLVCSWLCLLMLITAGCAMTSVSLDAQPSVTESRAKRDLGIDYLSTGRTAMAIRELTASIAMDPKDAQTHLWLGEAYRRKGQTDLALDFLVDAAELAEKTGDDRALHEAQLNLSALLSQLGRYEESVVYSDALAADPTESTPWRPLSNSGWALMKLGRLSEARLKLTEALDYFPNYGPALLNLGILEAKEGHRLAAIKAFELALGRLNTSGRAEVNYRLGELYMALGERDRAIEYFGEAVKTAPNLDWGSQSQAYLDLLL